MALHPLTILSLCSGAGGLDLGLKLAMPNARIVCHVEIEAFNCALLVSRMQEKLLDDAPVWTDLRTFRGGPWRGVVDCVIAGYPCQPFSVAGKRLGDKDPRHLWPEIARIIREVQPATCFFENVAGHLRLGFEQVHDDLCRMGYSVKAGLFTAAEVGSTHMRERLFILAYRSGLGCKTESDAFGGKHRTEERQAHAPYIFAGGSGGTAGGLTAHDAGFSPAAGGAFLREEPAFSPEAAAAIRPIWPPGPADREGWGRIPEEFKPAILRMADGMAARMDRVRTCGNGVVPLAAAYAFLTLSAHITPSKQS